MTWVGGSPLQTVYQKMAAAVGLFFFRMLKRPSLGTAFRLVPTYMACHFKIANRKKTIILNLPTEKRTIFSNLPTGNSYVTGKSAFSVPEKHSITGETIFSLAVTFENFKVEF
ncbi:MAG: hypothetical protein K6E31_07690 [bacterium]|nr:hypothetical protein [bacterium]